MPKTYLDDNGNPISSPAKVYLDDNGNPVAPQSFGRQDPTGEIRAVKPQGIAQNIEQWGSDLSGDIKYGSGRTFIGKLLQKAGAQPAYNGVSEGAADTVASMPLGAAQMVQGAGQIAQDGKRWAGTKNIVGGALQAATVPAAFVAPESPEAIAKGVRAVIPNTVSAGEKFQQVMAKAKDVPIPTETVGDAALRAQQLAASGGSMPKVIRDFLKRVTDPTKPQMTYAEARDFYSNASRLSGDEMNRLTPVMKRQVVEFTQQLGSAISSAANNVGEADRYGSAMREYRRASQIGKFLNTTGSIAAKAGAGAAGAGGAYELYSLLKSH